MTLHPVYQVVGIYDQLAFGSRGDAEAYAGAVAIDGHVPEVRELLYVADLDEALAGVRRAVAALDGACDE